MSFETISWQSEGVVMIDQTRLPLEELYVTCATAEEVARAIKSMVIRGAPAIGVAAAMGVALGMKKQLADVGETGFWDRFEPVCQLLAATRPTAVNLFWALDRMRKVWQRTVDSGLAAGKTVDVLINEACLIRREDIETNRKLGALGAEIVPENARVLTHCNAGALACAGYGTALGVIRAAHERGKILEVLADETRPLLQGARLTAWELQRERIPVTLITDNMAAYFIGKGMVDLVVVGADRIAANGDTANKIGTYGVAIIAREHQVPFYVAAPGSTIDFALDSGEKIPIEERDRQEVLAIGGQYIAPPEVAVYNPAFDVTPAKYITGIITEKGIFKPEELASFPS
ncbi:MAG: S-methyl-5-thioribose-1-phosphate isomerase [Pseudomonadota bacterium]|nr:S-methyl-5-thioribose-1-phosphate isomerase [Pseudomonadota bacterium]